MLKDPWMNTERVGFNMAKISISQEGFVNRIKSLMRMLLPATVIHSTSFALIRNWLFQGVVLMDLSELVYRILLEAVLVAVIYIPAWKIFDHSFFLFIICGALGHTIMWLFNGHFWALHIGRDVRLVRNKPQKIKKYLYCLERRVNSTSSIEGCIIFGSLARSKFHEYSDLDIVFSKKNGFLNSILAYSQGVKERALAFIKRIPIELYFYAPDTFVDTDKDEVPLLVKDSDNKWQERIPASVWLADHPQLSEGFFNHEK